MSLTATGRPLSSPVAPSEEPGATRHRYAPRSSPAAAWAETAKYSSDPSSPAEIRSIASAAVRSRTSPMLGLRGRDPKRPVVRIRCGLEDLLAGPARPRLVGPQDVFEPYHVRGRL